MSVPVFCLILAVVLYMMNDFWFWYDINKAKIQIDPGIPLVRTIAAAAGIVGLFFAVLSLSNQ